MDIVITYVNGLDPLWQKEYAAHTNVKMLEKRFRDWGTLRYLFRGIEKNMPFIRKVHLVVARESQVPEWVNRNEVNVVFHRDIIPAEYLPTFNCNPIETHLHFIKDLDEEFLYFNDDFFPIAECEPTDFFRSGKGVIKMSRHYFSLGMFRGICKNSDSIARKALNLPVTFTFLRPQHISSPMLKSECVQLYDLIKDELHDSLTHTREKKNVNQYVFLDYMYLKGLIIDEQISKKHFSVGILSIKKLCNFILHPTRKLICVNDVRIMESRFYKIKQSMIHAFETRFPEKSKYEL